MKKKKVSYEFPEYTRRKADVYEMDGVKYIREDLVHKKMESIMERIAIAHEAQAEFYKRWEKKMEPVIELMVKNASRL